MRKARWDSVQQAWLGCVKCGDPRLLILKKDRCPNCRSKREPTGKRCALCERNGLPTEEHHIYKRAHGETVTLCVSCHLRRTHGQQTWWMACTKQYSPYEMWDRRKKESVIRDMPKADLESLHLKTWELSQQEVEVWLGRDCQVSGK